VRGRKLADGSTRDTDWQRKEYERLMGREAAARQEMAARETSGRCICRSRVVRAEPGRSGYRTIHQRHCPRYKAWMESYLPPMSGAANAAAHAKAIHEGSKL
jgi:hypothetical protein